MDRNFARALPLVMKHEGGWADHPADPGGATMKGVTLHTFRRYVKADATKDDLRAITNEQIATVYYRHYWAAVNAQALPSGVDYAVFDFAVNSGPSRAAKYLQRIVSTTVDGRVGPKTLQAVEAMDPSEIIIKLCNARMAFLRKLKHWPTFGNGWTRRVSEVRQDALNMVGRPADVKRIPVPVEKPVVKDPENLDKPMAKSKTVWMWLTTAIGAPLAALADLDWRVQLVIVAVIVGFAIYAIKRRHDLAKVYRDLKAEFGEA
ncbi:glycoside hydrolase family 108 protein [Nitratireductor basaltis]|uniref:Uncharacterized protein n=1 Tax=Nitratireductor basaltis TaxID=472175 RepID=A0A084UDI5_9HYPH|nr:glycoside hydrolase family 108 protein [Nitratireductor basaltis]KFB11021.1 hypothetical protein EL18_02063 [Nitratireductor basaltis]